MADRTITTYLKLGGEAEYRAQLKSVSQEMGLLKSELAASESAFRGQANSMEALKSKGEILQKMYDAQKSKLDTLTTALNSAKSEQEKAASSVESYKEKLANAEKEMQRLQDSTEDTTEEEAALAEEIERLKNALSDAEEVQQKATNTVNKYQKEVNYAEVGLNKFSDELAENAKYMAEAEEAADGCATSIDEMGNKAEEAGKKTSDGISTMASALAAAGVAKSLKEIAEMLTECVQAAMEFETGMAEVFTLLPDLSGAARDQMSEDMMTFSTEMNVLTKEAIPALYSAISASVPADNVFSFLETAQKAAVGGVADLETAVDGLTSIVNAYGSETISAQKASDLMFTTVKLGKTTFGELSSSLYNVIPTAAAAGVSFEDISAALAAMTAQGTPTTVATTKLRQMLVELTDSGSEVSKTFTSIAGKSFKDFVASGGNVQQALQMLEQHAKASALGTDELFSSVEAGSAALMLTGNATETFVNDLQAMYEASGATNEAYSTMTETLEYKTQQVSVAFENLKTVIGSQLAPALGNLAEAGADALNWASGFLEDHPEIVACVTALAVGFGTLTLAVVGYNAAVKLAEIATNMWTAAMTTAKAAEEAVTKSAFFWVTAITAVVSAIVALVTILKSEATAAEQAREKLDELKTSHEEAVEAIQAESQNTLGLVSALENLIATQGDTAAGKEQILSLVGQLNEAVPNLALAYDAETNSLNMTAEAIRECARAEAERQEQQADFDAVTEAYGQQAELLDQLAEAQARLNEIEAEHGEKLASNSPLVASAADEYQRTKKEVADLQGALGEVNDFIAKTSDGLAKSSETTAIAIDLETASLEELEAELSRLEGEWEKEKRAAESSIKDQISLFEDWSNKSKITADEIIKNLESQAKYWTEYEQNQSAAIDRLSNKTGAGKDKMIEIMTSGTEQGAALAHALANGTDAEVDRILAAYNNAGNSATSYSESTKAAMTGLPAIMEQVRAAIEQKMNAVGKSFDKSAEARTAGANTGQGFLNGLSSKLSAIVAKARETANTVVATMRKTLNMHSPSKVMEELGGFTIDGFVEGIDGKQESIKEALSRTKKIVEDVFENNDTLKNQATRLTDQIEDYFETLSDSAKESAKTLRSALDEIDDRWEAVDNKRQKMMETLQAYGGLMGDSTTLAELVGGSLESSMKIDGDGDFFKRLSTSSDDGWVTLINNARTQSAFYKEYGNAVQAAAELGLNEDILKKYADGTEASAKILYSIVSGGQAVVDKINKLAEENAAQRDALADILKPYNETEQKNILSDIESQTEILMGYSDRLHRLEDRGIDPDLLQEVVGMGVEEAIQYSQALLDLSDEEWDKYMAAFGEKQKVAEAIATAWYKDELTKIEEEYKDTLLTGMETLKEYTFDYGKSTVDGIIEGMKSQEAALAAEAAKLANIVKSATSSGQLSFVGEYATGLSYVPYDNFPALLHKGERVLTREEAENYLKLPYLPELRKAPDTQSAAIVNALNTVAASVPTSQSGDLQVTFVINGQEFARATLEDFRNADRQNPVVVGDFV